MTGNDAVGEGAVRAGCDAYYGYPITPQNELTAYMAKHMPAHGKVFIQAESEIAAINMVYGTAAAGKRAMTSSSSPGISLKQEGISYLAGSELPAVIVNVQRGGPGLGNIAPSQADYFQAVKGGGHGDYHQIVLAPWSVQEMHDLTILAFQLADTYRTPVTVLADGRLGQMMEPLCLYEGPAPAPPPKPWALDGARGRGPNLIRSLYLVESEMEEVNLRLQKKYRRIAEVETRHEEQMTDDCEVLVVAYGTSARIAGGALLAARRAGIQAGLLRPITLWPFPHRRVAELAGRVKGVLAVEMSAGQMVEDVRLAVEGRVPVGFEGRMGGSVPTEGDVVAAIERMARTKRPVRDVSLAAKD
jgi:2-oxoglutarate ferredoxin oxidoreductase subunit alpha